MKEYEIIIGLEIHVQLKTKSKMFCGCDNVGEDKESNTTICPVCTGQPGTLPVINKQAVDWAVQAALALNCRILEYSKFDRKSYFYPDLPKGYQISQYDQPIGVGGFINFEINGQMKKIKITRLHLEEDAAKLIHSDKDETLVDFNRCGTPLIEIVTEADFNFPEEAKIFLQELRLIMRYLEISEADMEKGHLRCDANISLRPKGDSKLYPKTEIKNINSFRAVEKALAFEEKRQQALWEKGKQPDKQSTRGWNEKTEETEEQRVKEEEQDYRYFPEPDLPPLHFTKEYLKHIQSITVELPAERRERFISMYGFSKYEADILVSDKKLANYAEEVISELKEWINTERPKDRGVTWHTHKEEFIKLVANWLIHRLLALLNAQHLEIKELKVTPENFAELITLIYEKRVNQQTAQKVLEEMFKTGGDPSNIIEDKKLGQIFDENALGKIIDEVIKENPKVVLEYKNGKGAALQFLMGQVMKKTKGQAEPKILNELLVHKLK